MYDLLFSHISNKVSLTGQEREIIQPFFTPKKLRKRQYLIQEGEPCRFFAFVASGLLRSYNVDDKGHEHMIFFAPEGYWITDMYGFTTGANAIFNVDALEDAELLLLSREHFEALTLQVPAMDRYFRMLFQNSLVTKEFRLVSHHTHTAEEKYLHFVQSHPNLVPRLPQTLIASFLGLSPETLSRIKKNLATRKED
jgi:CRP-like cAMP-binding protein